MREAKQFITMILNDQLNKISHFDLDLVSLDGNYANEIFTDWDDCADSKRITKEEYINLIIDINQNVTIINVDDVNQEPHRIVTGSNLKPFTHFCTFEFDDVRCIVFATSEWYLRVIDYS